MLLRDGDKAKRWTNGGEKWRSDGGKERMINQC